MGGHNNLNLSCYSSHPAWKSISARGQNKKGQGKTSSCSSHPAKGQSSRLLKPTFLVSQAKQSVETTVHNKFLKTEKFKMETPESIRTYLQTGEWVTARLQGCLFLHTIHTQFRKFLVPTFSHPRSILQMQSTVFFCPQPQWNSR